MDNFEKATKISRLGCPVCGEHSLSIVCPNTTDRIFVVCQNEQCSMFGHRNPVSARTQIPSEEDIDKFCEFNDLAFAVKMQRKRLAFNSECIQRFKVSKPTKGLVETLRREKEFLRALRGHRFYTKGSKEKHEFVAADPRGNGLVRVRTLTERKKEIARIGYFLYGTRLALARECQKLSDFRKAREESANELEAQMAKFKKAKRAVLKLGSKQIWQRSPWKQILTKAMESD
jgi:hypothetical protein